MDLPKQQLQREQIDGISSTEYDHSQTNDGKTTKKKRTITDKTKKKKMRPCGITGNLRCAYLSPT
jgi:hypothetical protein